MPVSAARLRPRRTNHAFHYPLSHQGLRQYSSFAPFPARRVRKGGNDSVSVPLPDRRTRRLSVPKEARVLRTRLLALAALAALFVSATPAWADDAPKADPGHTAWMLVATAFVMLMVPGL